MIKLHIQNEIVRSNVAMVIETIRHQRKAQEERRRTIPFMLDRQTGQLQSAAILEGWLPIELHLDMDKHEVYITEREPERLFSFDELDKRGRQVLSETCHYLKAALARLHDIRELAHIELEPSINVIKERTFVHDAWHAIEREDAERILFNTSPGTYLFRKDRFAACLEEILGGAKKGRFKCLTLTYLDPKAQVRDRTIVHWNDRWLFYDDDPMLSGDYYNSLEELLLTMGKVLRRPLEAIRIKL